MMRAVGATVARPELGNSDFAAPPPETWTVFQSEGAPSATNSPGNHKGSVCGPAQQQNGMPVCFEHSRHEPSKAISSWY